MSSRTPSDADTQLKKSAALRGQVDRVERDEIVARARNTWLGRRLRFVNVVLTVTLLGVLAVDGWLAFDAFFRDGDAASPTRGTATEPTYKDLEVFERDGNFAGRITVFNPLDNDVELFVEVDLYDGDQNVGDVSGNMTLKSESESVLELDGYDDYVAYTESRIHDFGWTK